MHSQRLSMVRHNTGTATEIRPQLDSNRVLTRTSQLVADMLYTTITTLLPFNNICHLTKLSLKYLLTTDKFWVEEAVSMNCHKHICELRL